MSPRNSLMAWHLYQFMDLFGAMSALSRVASQFAPDGVFVNAWRAGASGLRSTGFTKCVKLVSWCLWKLCGSCPASLFYRALPLVAVGEKTV